MDLPVTVEELERWLYGKQLIQNIFPHLTAEQREFLLSGMSPDEQAKFYREDEQE